MGNAANITGWITLFTGIYVLAASIGELRRPGSWNAMIHDMQTSSAIKFITGFLMIAIGAAIYLVNPYDPSDILAVLITVLGAVICLEGIGILAFGDWYLGFTEKLLNMGGKIWIIFALLIGVIAILAGLARLQVF